MNSETTFFVIDDCPAGSAAEASFDWPDSQPVGEAPLCGLCGSCIGGLPLLPPYRFEARLFGDQFPDMYVQIGDQILVSEQLLTAFNKAGLRGLENWQEIHLKFNRSRKRNAANPPRYYISDVMRSETKLDRNASGLILEDGVDCERCLGSGGIVKYDRLRFISAGNESLFTTDELPGHLFADLKFKQLFEEGRFGGIRFCPADQYHFDGVFFECS